jgi:hypothetical protein
MWDRALPGERPGNDVDAVTIKTRSGQASGGVAMTPAPLRTAALAAAWLLTCALAAGACAVRGFVPPAGTTVAFPGAASAWEEATARCRGAQLFVAAIRINGWVGSRSNGIPSATMGTAVTRTNDIYLDIVPSFGGTYLQLAGRDGEATFLLLRDRRFAQEPAREILEALTGLRWTPLDLLDVMSGCVAPLEVSVRGERTGPFVHIPLSPTAEVWLRQVDEQWRVVAGRRDGRLIEYRQFEGVWPSDVRVTASEPAPLDLRFQLSQLQVNTDLPSSMFDLAVPSGFVSLTLEELRSIGPLRDIRQLPRQN